MNTGASGTGPGRRSFGSMPGTTKMSSKGSSALSGKSLAKRRKMVLSTAAGDRVSSRMMSVIQMEGLLYFQTDRAFLKYRQLAENKNAALCMDNIQIEGVCRELGHPMQNERFAGLYGKHFPGSFERYSGLKNERLFVMSPVLHQEMDLPGWAAL